MAKALLDQLAQVSRPGDGGPKLLLVFARLASSEIDWIDGALRVEMIGDTDVTVVEVLSELGLGMRERVFPSFKMSVPLDEFARAVERLPHMVAPLTISSATARRLVLTATVDEEEDEAPVAIADDSLYTRRGPKEKVTAASEPGISPLPNARPSVKARVGRKSSRPAPEEVKPAAVHPRSGKTLRPAPPPAPSPEPSMPPPPAFPKAPAVPRTDTRHLAPAAPGNRAVVAKVPLTRIRVPRGSRPPAVAAIEKPADRVAAASAKPPKTPSVKAPAKRASKPPERRAASSPPARSVAPKRGASRRAPAVMSEPPDEEGIDMGWEDSGKE